jgi:hypothetical protein
LFPLRDDQFGLVARDPGGDRLPPATGGRDRLERQPAPVPDLDCIAAGPGGEQLQNPALEEGRVHTELQGDPPAEVVAEVVDHRPQEGDGLLGVVDVDGAVLQPQDVAGLGDVGQERIVAGVFPMMRVETSERPAHRGPGPDHRAIHVDRDPRQGQARQRLGHEVAVERDERRQRLLRELAEPVRHGAPRGQPGQAAEAGDQRVAAQEAEVFQPSGADVEQGQEDQGEPRASVVTRQPGEYRAQSCGQVDALQVPPQQLQAAVGRERLGHELDGEIALDHPSQGRYLQAHQRGLQCVRERMGMLSLKSALGALLIPMSHSIMPRLLAVWG